MSKSVDRLLRTSECNLDGHSGGTLPGAEVTEVGSAAVESQPRIRPIVTLGDWQDEGKSLYPGGRASETEGQDQDARSSDERVRYDKGNRIGGRYEVLDIFGGPGRSGMGVVYKCFDCWDRRLCALKSFQDQPVWCAEAAKTFRREAELWIAVGHHPHVVVAQTIRRPDGRLYLVLEYIEPDEHGRNCLSHFLTGCPLPMDQILKWAVQCCWGMEYAVKNGIQCHRDIKPDNLMIDREGYLKITDFGLARAFDGLPSQGDRASPAVQSSRLSLITTHEGTTCGSPPWMPPEQFGGAKSANARSDVYSFGVVLYQMLSGGTLPFVADSVQQYAALHQHAPVPTMNSLLAPLVERCMAKHPEDRYADFGALRHDLETYADGLNVHVPAYQELPETAEQFKDWASSLYHLGRFEEAMAFADRAVDENRDYCSGWINHSQCCLALKKPLEAVKSAERALELDSDNALALTNLACAYREMGKHTEAFSAAQRATESDPELVEAWNALGALHHLHRQYREAIECYRKVLKIDPFFFDACMNLALSYCGVEDAQQAYRWYVRAAEIDPDNCDAVQRRDEFGEALGIA